MTKPTGKLAFAYQSIARLEAERDTLAAELGAIRAAGGEEVEVVAEVEIIDESEGSGGPLQHYCHLTQYVPDGAQLMTVAQHQRIVAAMAAELERLKRDNDYVSENLEVAHAERMELRAELEAARKQEPDSDADLATRMKAAGMMSAAELLAGAPLDAFTRHAAVNDLQSLLQWAEMRRAECLKAQARYDLGERDKSDDLYEWTVAHCAVFTELHVNIRAALAGLPPLAGQVSKPEAWTVMCGDWRDTTLAIHGEKSGHIASGIPEGAAHAIAKAHNAVVGADGALLATPSMEVKHDA